MSFDQCQFVRTNGTQCGSPAMRNKSFCYYHVTSNRPSALPGQHGYYLPLLEDPEVIQLTLSKVLRSIVLGYLDLPRARTMLHGLQLAATNIRRTNFRPRANDVVTEISEALCALENHGTPTPDQELTSAL
jgi:hypothetical protein